MDKLINRITIDDKICNGKPTIRGYRLTVQTVIEFVFSCSTEEEILKQDPFFEKEDIEAYKAFALLMLDTKYTIKGIAA